MRPILLISMGDPAGVGPEVILKALWKLRGEIQNGAFLPVIVGDLGVLKLTIEALRLPIKVEEVSSLEDIKGTESLKVINLSDLSLRVKPGHPTSEGGKAALEYVIYATRLILQGKAHALVTAPLSKSVVALSGQSFKGHTELLAELSNTRDFAMMFVGDKLKVSLVTTHIPYKEVPRALTVEKVFKKALLTKKALEELFGIMNPKLALCGLNPHAGEEGQMGEEEIEILFPAVKRAMEEGVNLQGPFAADSLFFWAYRGKWDAVIALYHDQGLIPFKIHHFHKGVNLTIGLPFIRTSPDHGTAYDIAGKGKANPQSMMEALKLAAYLAKRKLSLKT
jgi:4-hydroxythreonine-4-phosphate dehydrogenase